MEMQLLLLFLNHMCLLVFLSLFFYQHHESVISFVIEPPIKNIIAINPIVRGKVSIAFPNTLQLASMPRSPRGIPTHSWFTNSIVFASWWN